VSLFRGVRSGTRLLSGGHRMTIKRPVIQAKITGL
jgi:hypothetical protein